MRERTNSMEVPSQRHPMQASYRERRVSYGPEVSFNGKMEKYRMLLEKEYELRLRLSKTRDLDERKRRCVSFCDCGRQVYAAPPCNHNNGAPKSILRNHTAMHRLRPPILRRPLSADHITTPSASTIRKLVAEEKADKRRASIKSLEEEFAKFRVFMRRCRTLSSDDLETSPNESSNENGSCDSVTSQDYLESKISIIRERPKSCLL